MHVYIVENQQCGQTDGCTQSMSEPKGSDPGAPAATADNLESVSETKGCWKFQSTRLKRRHSGWSKGIQGEHDSRKRRKGKIRFNKSGEGEFHMVSSFYLAAVSPLQGTWWNLSHLNLGWEKSWRMYRRQGWGLD